MPADALLTDLTDPQREAVTHRDGPLLVLAAAGSGKTRVITRRAAWLAAHAGARHVLAITFTNKAAEEMRQRIAALGVGRGLAVGTFHSFCARLLRQHADRAGIEPNYSIFDQTDRGRAIKDAISRCELASEAWKPSNVELRISQAKNHMLAPDGMLAEAVDFRDQTIARIYAQYEQILAENNALDFDDLLLRVAQLLDRDKALRSELEERFAYVLVDEYQDTNRAQYLIARRLTETRRNICATGDPDQSIYGWRGANLANILDFESDYPDAKVVRLEQNYRSTRRILRAADELIQANRRRKEKRLWTENPEGVGVCGFIYDDAQDEADGIAEQIARLHERGRSLGQIAIFYRVNAMTRVLEEALRKKALSYQIARGVEFYNRKEIKDVLAYLRVMVNPSDEISLVRIINTPARGIGKTTIDRLRAHATETKRRAIDLVAAAETVSNLKAAAAKRIGEFAALLEKLRKVAAGDSVREIVEKTLSLTGLERTVADQAGGDSDQVGNLAELVSAAAEYDQEHTDQKQPLQGWLEQVSLVSDVDKLDGPGAVSLMTLHAAKGLEFDVVFIAGLEEGLLPHLRSRDSADELEEERRLCFVGMTRARQELYLSYALYRSLRGSTTRTIRSPFVDDLEGADIEWHDRSGARDARPRRTTARSEAERLALRWRVGQLMYHPEYGTGRLVRLNRSGSRTMVRVRFTAYGEKSFSVEHNELEAVEIDGDFEQ
ncbi:MAG TPA: UvrD-helicase domain-containing protein [Phycisphaerae bacterium]|nr:UvrD-helicase domain-containing protein [Phycisphaerae bacterium]